MIFEYTIIRSKRKSIAIQVDCDCKITVRAPLRMNEKEIEDFVNEKKQWLEKAVASQLKKSNSQRIYTEAEIKALRKKAKEIIPLKVNHYANIMGVEPRSVKINSAKKRYGSCSGDNNLNFSLYLLDKDERFIDYVVVHELAHIKHHNHSKDFYKFIEKFMPDYKERSKL